MVRITESNNIYILEYTDYNLKIDNNLVVYVKLSNQNSFRKIGKCEYGLTNEQKKRYLYNLHSKILESKNKV